MSTLNYRDIKKEYYKKREDITREENLKKSTRKEKVTSGNQQNMYFQYNNKRFLWGKYNSSN